MFLVGGKTSEVIENDSCSGDDQTPDEQKESGDEDH
jgi:hypothetical protein